MDLIITIFSQITILDILDILIVAFLLYKLYDIISYTRAVQLIKGAAVFFIVLWISDLAKLRILNYILVNVLSFGVLALVIIFQPEIRRALEYIGRNRFVNNTLFPNVYAGDFKKTVDDISWAVEELSANRTGALIVLEGNTGLKDIMETGTTLDSAVSKQLLTNIFIPKAPLHDGAVIISKNRIQAAGCLLPLSSDRKLSRDLGTRHRAALGMSANSDALIIVVSEETGVISVARNNELTRHIGIDDLNAIIYKFYSADSEE